MKNFLQQGVVLTVVLVLAACGSPYRPPVDELGGAPRFLDAGRTHRVNSGETLYAVAWMYDLDFAALARVNQLREPYALESGQMLLIDLRGEPANTQLATTGATVPAGATGVTVNPVQVAGGISRTPLGNAGLQRTPLPETSPSQTSPPATGSPTTTNLPQPATGGQAIPAPNASTTATAPVVAVTPRDLPAELPTVPALPAISNGPIQWAWPANGEIVGRFSDSGAEQKGLDIAGRRGDPVRAAADGQVVYAGSGLLRYGDLIILKHDERHLSAYAHNDRILVQEGAMVKRGDTIAELGSSGIDRTMLHFEVRVEGTPQDPLLFLPPR